VVDEHDAVLASHLMQLREPTRRQCAKARNLDGVSGTLGRWHLRTLDFDWCRAFGGRHAEGVTVELQRIGRTGSDTPAALQATVSHLDRLNGDADHLGRTHRLAGATLPEVITERQAGALVQAQARTLIQDNSACLHEFRFLL
jgi:hypothetical protein